MATSSGVQGSSCCIADSTLALGVARLATSPRLAAGEERMQLRLRAEVLPVHAADDHAPHRPRRAQRGDDAGQHGDAGDRRERLVRDAGRARQRVAAGAAAGEDEGGEARRRARRVRRASSGAGHARALRYRVDFSYKR